MILISVIVIGSSAGGGDSEDESEIDSSKLFLSIMLAILTGFVMSMQSLALKKGFTEYGFNPN